MAHVALLLAIDPQTQKTASFLNIPNKDRLALPGHPVRLILENPIFPVYAALLWQTCSCPSVMMCLRGSSLLPLPCSETKHVISTPACIWYKNFFWYAVLRYNAPLVTTNCEKGKGV